MTFPKSSYFLVQLLQAPEPASEPRQPISNISMSHERVSSTAVPQPSVPKPAASDVLSTSGTFEKVPSPAPESFEQLSMSQVQESGAAAPSSSQEPSAASVSQPAVAAAPSESGALSTYVSCTFVPLPFI